MHPTIERARDFADVAHEGVQRKYTGDPYFFHVSRVACMVWTHPGSTTSMVAAAFLHDILEDTDHTLLELESKFGLKVSALVSELTNVSKLEHPELNRAARKRIDADRLAGISKEAKIIKMFDRIDNLRDMGGADGGFKRLYIEESRALLSAVKDADGDLATRLGETIDDLEDTLE